MTVMFRKSALERLSSPEQLNKAITVSKPATWLALLGASVIVVSTILWAMTGTLPTTIPVQGIAVGAGESTIVECFVPYIYAGRINAGMRAIVHDPNDDKRYEANVTKVRLDNTEFSDMELALGGNDVIASISLQLNNGVLQKRTLVTASIIIQENTPLSMLFRGLR